MDIVYKIRYEDSDVEEARSTASSVLEALQNYSDDLSSTLDYERINRNAQMVRELYRQWEEAQSRMERIPDGVQKCLDSIETETHKKSSEGYPRLL